MQVASVGSTAGAIAAASPAEASSVLIAKKALDQAKQQGQQTLALIQAAAPPGTGRLLNVMG